MYLRISYKINITLCILRLASKGQLAKPLLHICLYIYIAYIKEIRKLYGGGMVTLFSCSVLIISMIETYHFEIEDNTDVMNLHL